MSSSGSTDSAGRKQPSTHRTRKRAETAAKHRWKHKCELIPGNVRPWSERSFANKLEHLAAAKKGGETTGHRIKEQQRLFWRWYHGSCKEQLEGPFEIVVHTFERIEAAYAARYGHNGPKTLAWDGYFARMLHSFVFTPCWKRNTEDLKKEMWELYDKFMQADDAALFGDADGSGLLSTLFAHEDALEERKLRIERWRDKRGRISKSNKDK